MEDKDSFSNIDFSKFKFSGRTEFFEPDCLGEAQLQSPLVVRAYRLGFARGCRAGADDIMDFLGVGGETRKEASKAFLDAQEAMIDAVPHRKTDTVDTRCNLRPVKNLAWKKGKEGQQP